MAGFRFCSQQAFLTYPQASNTTKAHIVDFFKTLCIPSQRSEDKYVERILVAEERHEDGNRHFHAYIKFSTKVDIADERLFDVDGHHPNIQGVRSAKNVLDYCKKDGDFISLQRRVDEWVEWNQSVKRTWGELLEAAQTAEEFMLSVRQNYPRDYALSYDQLQSMANANFKSEKPVYTPRFSRDSFTRFPELDDWINNNLKSDSG